MDDPDKIIDQLSHADALAVLRALAAAEDARLASRIVRIARDH